MNNTKYYIVDGEIYVKIYQDEQGNYLAVNQYGNTYEPVKALFEGRPTDQETFEAAESRASKSRLASE